MKRILSVIFFSASFKRSLYAAEAGMPQLDPYYWASQAFWLIIIFSSVYFLISKIFIPKIKSNIDSREDKIRKDIEEASLLKEKAEKKLKHYNELIMAAKLDAKKILSDGQLKLNEDIETKKIQIDKDIAKETKNAETEIYKFKQNSLNKVTVISEDIASKLIEDIFGEDLNKSSVEASVQQTIKEYQKGK